MTRNESTPESLDGATAKSQRATRHIVMLLENSCYPDDTRVLDEATALREAGYQVTVICPSHDGMPRQENVDGVEVRRYPAPPEGDGMVFYVIEFGLSLLAAFWWTLLVRMRGRFDAIHVHAPPDMNAWVGRFWRIFGVRFVLDTHDLSPELYMAQRNRKTPGSVGRVLLWFERRACRGADRLIATNQTQRKVQIDRGGAHAQNCCIVRNGPGRRFLVPADPHPSLTDENLLQIGYVGMISVQDGVDHLVEAAAVLAKTRDDFRVTIIGDGPAVPMLRQLVVQRGLEERVTFTGLVPHHEVPSYIAGFDVCVTPDPSNPYNDSCTTIKTMEYMALSRPTVAYETNENRFTAADSACYAKAPTPNALAEAIAGLLDDPQRRQRLGRLGRERVEQQFAWKHQRAELLRLYDSLFSIAVTPASQDLGDSTAIQADQALVDWPTSHPSS